jgi:hypothetical protein
MSKRTSFPTTKNGRLAVGNGLQPIAAQPAPRKRFLRTVAFTMLGAAAGSAVDLSPLLNLLTG